jgi:hypothetical protein
MNKSRIRKLLPMGILFLLALASCAPAASPQSTSPENTSTSEVSATPITQNPSACTNPFNPVIEGRTLTYRIESSEPTQEFSITFQNVTSSSFDTVTQFPDVSSTIQWTCNSEGLLSSDFASLNIAQIPNINIETLDVSGVAFPPADKWDVGYAWDLVFNVKVTANIGGNTIEGTGEIALSNQIAAIEAVSVPAGDYPESYRVDSTGNFKFGALGVDTNIPITYSSWYVKDVGMVKSGSDSAEVGYTTELVSINE